MMRGGQHSTPPSTYKIPNRFTIHEIPGGNWGWHIRFTEEAEGTHGLWLRSAPFLDDARGEYEFCSKPVLIDAGEDASAPFLDDAQGEYELCAKPVLIDAGEDASAPIRAGRHAVR